MNRPSASSSSLAARVSLARRAGSSARVVRKCAKIGCFSDSRNVAVSVAENPSSARDRDRSDSASRSAANDAASIFVTLPSRHAWANLETMPSHSVSSSAEDSRVSINPFSPASQSATSGVAESRKMAGKPDGAEFCIIVLGPVSKRHNASLSYKISDTIGMLYTRA